ncbi:uncharacterized protein [Battus philenor]|uniref:uncharacterized protein n=1 Tax=Battus philenor TaxID=42288 RepID=UPI0035CFAAB3
MDKSDTESCPVRGTLAIVLRISKFHGAVPLHLEPCGDGYIARVSKSGACTWIFLVLISVTIGAGLVMDLHVFGTSTAIRVKTTSSMIVWLSDLVTLFTIAVVGVIQGESRMKKALKILNAIRKLYVKHFLTEKHPSLSYNSLPGDNIRSATMRNKWISQTDDVSARDSIRRLSDSYILLYKVVGNFNDDNGLLLLILLASYIGYTFITNYYIIRDICAPDLINKWKNVSSILIPVEWTVLRFIEIFAVIESFHRTHDEMSATQVLLSKAIYCMTPVGQPMCTELNTFCKQILLYKPLFSPLSICTLQRSQLAGIIAGVITYMIIIIQYRLIEECK